MFPDAWQKAVSFDVILQLIALRIYLTMTRDCIDLVLTVTTVSPLTGVCSMVRPGVPPNAGLFVSFDGNRSTLRHKEGSG